MRLGDRIVICETNNHAPLVVADFARLNSQIDVIDLFDELVRAKTALGAWGPHVLADLSRANAGRAFGEHARQTLRLVPGDLRAARVALLRPMGATVRALAGDVAAGRTRAFRRSTDAMRWLGV